MRVCALPPQVKDVEAQLWKNVFYRYIEDFRQRLKKFSAAAAAGEPRAEESVAKARRLFRTRAALACGAH